MTEGVFTTGFGPILVLWIGALVFYILDRYLEPQDRGFAEVVVLTLALGFLLSVQAQIGVPAAYGHALVELGWGGTIPFTILSREMWLLSLLLLGSATVAALASIGTPARGRSGRLAALGAALLYLSAGDWATLAFAWCLVDLSLLCTLNARGVSQERLTWTASLSLIGPILVGVALAVWQGEGAHAWVDRSGPLPGGSLAPAAMPALAAVLLAVAASLRLMPYPLPSWFSLLHGDRAPAPHARTRVLVTVLPAVLGATVWARLAGWEGLAALPISAAVGIWGGIALLVGAARAWGAQDPAQVIACLNVVPGAMVLLAVGRDTPESWLLLVGTGSVLAMVLLYVAWTQCQFLDLYDPHTYWRALPSVVGLVSLSGLPLSAGFPVRATVYWAAFSGGRWAALALTIVGEALLLGALLRVLLELECVIEPEGAGAAAEALVGLSTGAGEMSRAVEPGPVRARLQRVLAQLRQFAEQEGVVYAAGAVLALALFVLGVSPRPLSANGLGAWMRLPTLPMWAALLLPVVGSIVVYRYRDRVLDIWAAWWPLFERLLSLDGIYRGAGRVLQAVGNVLWGGMLLLEGAGHMAWVVLVGLLILLFVIAR